MFAVGFFCAFTASSKLANCFEVLDTLRESCDIPVWHDDAQGTGCVTLAGLINASDSRINGGCFVPRLIRGPSGGFLSRHSFGIAIDVNPSTNPFGGTPTMDARIVEILAGHGFSWGGTWTRPDGMHFEWTGTPES